MNPITVAETSPYRREAKNLFSEEEQRTIIDKLARNPECGNLIPETGGIRKLRQARKGMGKRSGVRIIYYFHNPSMPLFLLALYAKNDKENLSKKETAILAQLVKQLVIAYKEPS